MTGLELGALALTDAFDIAARKVSMRSFHLEEVKALCAQCCTETGQVFEPDAVDITFQFTKGQPQLVNELARLLIEELVTDRDMNIKTEHVERAKRELVERRETSLSGLRATLRDPLVRTHASPVLAGASPSNLNPEGIRLLLDLGLFCMRSEGGIEVANPIYEEVMMQEFGSSMM